MISKKNLRTSDTRPRYIRGWVVRSGNDTVKLIHVSFEGQTKILRFVVCGREFAYSL